MDPITIMAGISAVGALFKGISGFFAGSHEQQAAQANAAQHLGEAGVNAQQSVLEGEQATAHAAVQGAANGGGFGGSNLGILRALSTRAMFNARAAAYRGRTQARADIYQGDVAKTEANQALFGGILQAGSSLAGGFAQSAQAGQYMQMLKYGGASPGDPSTAGTF